MKIIKYLTHYFFGKHKWRFVAKSFKGNDKIGHKEDTYIFECKMCHKRKVIKVD